MKKIKNWLVGLLALSLSVAAFAQFAPGQILTAAQLNAAFANVLPIAGGTLTGPLTVPTLTATTALNTAHANITGGTISGLSAPLPQASGGTNCATASGNCLDNITGFGSTGLLRRTGAGAYSFGTTVSIGEGGTGATTQAGALAAVLGTSTVPITNGGTGATSITAPGGAFDTLCSSTIGQMWVRLTSAWGCSALG